MGLSYTVRSIGEGLILLGCLAFGGATVYDMIYDTIAPYKYRYSHNGMIRNRVYNKEPTETQHTIQKIGGAVVIGGVVIREYGKNMQKKKRRKEQP